MNLDRYFKLSEVQAMLEISRSTLWRWHSERGLKIIKVGNLVRVKESDLLAFLKRHQTVGIRPETSQEEAEPIQAA